MALEAGAKLFARFFSYQLQSFNLFDIVIATAQILLHESTLNCNPSKIGVIRYHNSNSTFKIRN